MVFEALVVKKAEVRFELTYIRFAAIRLGPDLATRPLKSRRWASNPLTGSYRLPASSTSASTAYLHNNYIVPMIRDFLLKMSYSNHKTTLILLYASQNLW